MCFKRAEDRVGETLANAYITELSAVKSRAADKHDESCVAYSKACDLFLEAGQILKAVECQIAMGNTIAAAGKYRNSLILLLADQKLTNSRRYLI